MKTSSSAASATSLPRAPRDDAEVRSKRYLITMGIRVLCFILMVLITPYGWYTWVFGIAAVCLPYIAVVTANVSANVRSTDAESPERALTSTVTPDAASGPAVVRIEETPAVEAAPATDEPG